MDIENLRNYFSDARINKSAKVVDVPGTHFEVTTYYLEDIVEIVKFKPEVKKRQQKKHMMDYWTSFHIGKGQPKDQKY